MIIFKILPIAFFLFGSLFVVGSFILVRRRRVFLQKAIKTTGTVIHVDVRRDSGMNDSLGSTHYYPTVRFQTTDGQQVDCKINFSAGQVYTIGQQVVVNYDSHNPCNGVVLGDQKSQTLIPFIIFGFVGAIFALIGLVWGILSFS